MNEEERLDNFTRLKKMKNLELICNDPFFIEHFRNKYQGNLLLMALELFRSNLTYQQVDIVNSHKWNGGENFRIIRTRNRQRLYIRINGIRFFII